MFAEFRKGLKTLVLAGWGFYYSVVLVKPRKQLMKA